MWTLEGLQRALRSFAQEADPLIGDLVRRFDPLQFDACSLIEWAKRHGNSPGEPWPDLDFFRELLKMRADKQRTHLRRAVEATGAYADSDGLCDRFKSCVQARNAAAHPHSRLGVCLLPFEGVESAHWPSMTAASGGKRIAVTLDYLNQHIRLCKFTTVELRTVLLAVAPPVLGWDSVGAGPPPLPPQRIMLPGDLPPPAPRTQWTFMDRLLGPARVPDPDIEVVGAEVNRVFCADGDFILYNDFLSEHVSEGRHLTPEQWIEWVLASESTYGKLSTPEEAAARRSELELESEEHLHDMRRGVSRRIFEQGETDENADAD